MVSFLHIRGRYALGVLFALGLSLMGGSVLAQEEEQASVVEDEAAAVAYEVRIEGIVDLELLARLRALSECVQMQDDGANTTLHLRRRMSRDVPTFSSLLRSEGYYWNAVDGDVDESGESTAVVFRVTLGERCRFDGITIKPVNPEYASTLPSAESLGLKVGEPARATLVRSAESMLINMLQNEGFPFPKIAEREAVVDSQTKTMDVLIEVDTGGYATFGEVMVSGLKHVDETVVTVERPFLKGDEYDLRKTDLFRKRLYDTGLFTVVQVQALPINDDGTVPVEVDVVERDQRTLGFGANYYTDEGLGITAQWEHRNLWNKGRRLEVKSQFSQQLQSLGATLTFKNYRRRLQDLRFSVLGAAEDRDAYDSDHIGGRVWITRRLSNPRLSAGVGAAIRFSDIKQFDEQNTYYLFSVPTELAWDSSDDLLDPTKGIRVRGQLEPFVDLGGESSQFLKGAITASLYQSLDDQSNWILASRFKLGSVAGASTKNLPPDERFYAGGGGSVRGYPYQSIGPQFRDDPFGGSSLVETSVEMRYRISETIGAVAFVDGGSAFDSEYPDFEEPLRWGAGVGIRYYSPIGPFRLDVAVPINKPDYIDENFQVYLSIGQAF